MKTFNFILHISAFVLFTFAVRNIVPYEFAIMIELFAIFNNTQYKGIWKQTRFTTWTALRA